MRLDLINNLYNLTEPEYNIGLFFCAKTIKNRMRLGCSFRFIPNQLNALSLGASLSQESFHAQIFNSSYFRKCLDQFEPKRCYKIILIKIASIMRLGLLKNIPHKIFAHIVSDYHLSVSLILVLLRLRSLIPLQTRLSWSAHFPA